MPRKHQQDPNPPALPQSLIITRVQNSAVTVGSGNYVVQSSKAEAEPAAIGQDNAASVVRRPARAQTRSPTQPTRGQATGSDADSPGYVFISYVREDSAHVDRLQRTLETADVPVWRDTASLQPGGDWKAGIRQAITHDAAVFVACFSRASIARDITYQREELLQAITHIRERRPDVPWLIPVRFDACAIPELDLGAGRILTTLQRADLFGPDYDKNAALLTTTVKQVLSMRPPSPKIGALGG